MLNMNELALWLKSEGKKEAIFIRRIHSIIGT
jgi:hypothetical protein